VPVQRDGQTPDSCGGDAAGCEPVRGGASLWDCGARTIPMEARADGFCRADVALARWSALCRFLEDGRVELDNNPVERAIRPIALGRKNHLFAGSDGGAARWATVCSLITTAKLNDVEPFAYLRDILERMSDGHPISQLDDLLPWNWQKTIVKHIDQCATAGRLPLAYLRGVLECPSEGHPMRRLNALLPWIEPRSCRRLTARVSNRRLRIKHACVSTYSYNP